HDLCAFRSETARNRPPNATAGSGYDCGFAIQAFVHACLARVAQDRSLTVAARIRDARGSDASFMTVAVRVLRLAPSLLHPQSYPPGDRVEDRAEFRAQSHM